MKKFSIQVDGLVYEVGTHPAVDKIFIVSHKDRVYKFRRQACGDYSEVYKNCRTDLNYYRMFRTIEKHLEETD